MAFFPVCGNKECLVDDTASSDCHVLPTIVRETGTLFTVLSE